MPLLLQRCASGHCHPEWWHFSLSFLHWDPEGFGATPACFQSSFHTQLWVKSQFQLKQSKLSNFGSNYHKYLSSLCFSGGPGIHSRIVNTGHSICLYLGRNQKILERVEEELPSSKTGKRMFNTIWSSLFQEVVTLLTTKSGTFSRSLKETKHCSDSFSSASSLQAAF